MSPPQILSKWSQLKLLDLIKNGVLGVIYVGVGVGCMYVFSDFHVMYKQT